MLIDKYYNYLKNNSLNKVVTAPQSMTIPNSEDEEGWIEWKPVKSKIKEEDLKELEKDYKITFPKDYLDFITDKQFMDIQIDKYTLYGINELNTLNKLVELFPKDMVTSGFFPIGNINNGDFLALNTNNGNVVKLSFNDFNIKEKVFNNFREFENYLLNKIP